MRNSKNWALALIIGLIIGAGLNVSWAQGPLTSAPNLRVRTNESGYLLVSSSAASGTDGPLTNFGNIRLRTDSNGYLLTSDAGGVGAPAGATYITQIANATLSAEQALSTLSSGIMRVATTTGVITALTDSAGVFANISDETGTGTLVGSTNPAFAGLRVTSGALIAAVYPMAFGDTTTSSFRAFYLAGSFSGLRGLDNEMDVTPGNGNDGEAFYNSPTFSEGTSGNHSLLAGARFRLPAINGNTATVTDTATVYIDNQTTATVSGANHALWVAAGRTRFDGNVYIGNATGEAFKPGVPAVTNTSANSCGTSAASLVGKNMAGKITVGATSGTSCTITFSAAWSNAPACDANDETTTTPVKAISTTTTVILTGSFTAADVIAYTCTGY